MSAASSAAPAASVIPVEASATSPVENAKPIIPGLPPATRFVLNNLFAIRYNALGLENQTRTGLQVRLYDSESPLTRDNFVFLGFTPRINPAYLKFGHSLEIQPLSIFNLKMGAEVISYFRTFGFLQSFDSPNVNYSDSLLAQRKEGEKHYRTEGFHFMMEPLVQLKVGPIAVRNKTAIEYWAMNVRSGDTVFYDATLDTLVPANGWVMANDLDVLYLTGGPLTVGMRYSMVRPYYKETDYHPGESEARANGHHRVGPLVAYTFYDEGFSTFNKPTVLAIVNWYVSHRWRTGEDKSRAVPYFVLGFASQSDFLGTVD